MSSQYEQSNSVKFPDSWQAPKTPAYGTYPGSHNFEGIDRYKQAVVTAIHNGFRHIDTAQTYKNEKYIGQGIIDSQIQREEIFVTSKLSPNMNFYQGALQGIKDSRSELKTDLDLYLIHYPGIGEATKAWKGLIEAKSEGLCKHIGVSNFEIKHLEELLLLTDECPEVNQIEFHPFLYSNALMNLVQYCKEKSIQVEGYCPLVWGDKSTIFRWNNILEVDAIKVIAAEYRVSSAQVVLKWCMQHGVLPIVGALKTNHISENLGPYDFLLTPDEMESINALGAKQFRLSLEWGWDPPNAKML